MEVRFLPSQPVLVSMNANEKKRKQLGMAAGTANARLRKLILFSLVQKTEQDICFRCGKRIETVDELSIEHKKDWLDVSVELFWDLDNIAFSHLSCNVAASKKPHRKYFTDEQWRSRNAKRARKQYTPDKRRKKYLKTGF